MKKYLDCSCLAPFFIPGEREQKIIGCNKNLICDLCKLQAVATELGGAPPVECRLIDLGAGVVRLHRLIYVPEVWFCH